jgi:hypothetical protein
MRMLLLIGMVCLLGGCGGDSSDGEVCMIDADCKMDPGQPSVCKDARTLIRYDIPKCSADQRCEWPRVEEVCGHSCEDGYCITAGVR